MEENKPQKGFRHTDKISGSKSHAYRSRGIIRIIEIYPKSFLGYKLRKAHDPNEDWTPQDIQRMRLVFRVKMSDADDFTSCMAFVIRSKKYK